MIWSLAPELLFHQLIFVVIGLVLLIIFSQIDIEVIGSFSWLIYLFSVIFLVSTFVFGRVSRGAVRWIEIGNFTLQPSELVKPLVILFFASFLAKIDPKEVKRVIGSLILLLPIFFLVLNQPDLGSSLLIFISWLGVVVASGLSLVYLAGGAALLAIFSPLIWLFLKDYQKERILSFLNPYQDPLKTGYHVIQSMITVGSGGIFGWGLGKGGQSQLLFLPERHTDFIFASLSEEIGFLGGLLLLVAYALLFFRILKIAQVSSSGTGRLFCLGFFSQLLFQVFVNIGMNMGMVPITGITLPLVSYGGSSLVATMVGLGMVMSVRRFSFDKKEALEIK
jgi:rod shape determining protein RodA